jgi:fucokinase
VESHCDLPKGSGLGTSSLLAIALTAALSKLCGVERAMDDLFQDVLCLEQMLTTGGGWQDQIGGAVGGYKLIRTGPGVSQKPSIQKVDAAHVALKEFDERLVVYYTGAQRLAKNILRVVVGRYLSRDAEVVSALHRLHGVAEDLWSAMGNGDVDRIGALMNEAWCLNKVLNPGSTAPAIDDLIDGITDLCSGVKLVGAGGGGFLVALAKSRHAAAELRERLGAWSPDGRVYNHAIADEGLVVTT